MANSWWTICLTVGVPFSNGWRSWDSLCELFSYISTRLGTVKMQGQSETWIFTLSTLFTDCVDYFYGIFLNLENGVKFQFILTYISLRHFTRWSETSNQAGLIESVHFRQSRTTIQVGFRGAAMEDTSGTQKWERSWWWWASVIVTVICSLL